MAKQVQQPRQPGKISAEDQQDVLDQIISDDEDQDQLGDGTTDDDNDDDTTGPVGGDDDDDDDDTSNNAGNDDDDDDDEFDPKERLAEDAKGNLIKDGKIVAKAGKERGILEKLKLRLNKREGALLAANKQLGQIAEGTRQLMEKYKALQEEKGYGQSLGLEPTEQKEALEMFARAKIDPKAVIKQILTKAHLAGTDLTDIGVSGPLDPAEVARHVLQLQEKDKKPATTPVDEAPATKEARVFFEAHPEAKDEPDAVLDAVAQAKNKYPQHSLSYIYVKIKEHLATKAKQPQGQKQQQQRPQDRPIAHNGTNGSRRPNVKGLDTQARSPNKSFNDIGKELLADLQKLEE